MPKIADKRKVLGGRGAVVLYASGTSAGQFFYRELIKGTKNYKTRRIDGVSTMDEAEAAATEVAFELNKEPELSILWDKPRAADQNNPSVTTSLEGLSVESPDPSRSVKPFRTGCVSKTKQQSRQ